MYPKEVKIYAHIKGELSVNIKYQYSAHKWKGVGFAKT